MTEAAWSDLLQDLAGAHGMWEAAKSVVPADEQKHWSAADGLFLALMARTHTLAGDEATAIRLRPHAGALQVLMADMIRLSAPERLLHLPEVYDQLLVCLQAAQTPQASQSPRPGQEPAEGSPAPNSTPMPAPTFDEHDLVLYEQDAKAQSHLMWAYAFLGTLLVGCVVVRIFELVSASPSSGSVSWQSLGGLAILGVLALAAGHQARECRRAAFETRRVHRQLLSLDRYLSPLPVFGRDLLRGVMVQRLFPRLLDDDNPMREDDEFPTMDTLMLTLSPQYRNTRRRQMEKDQEQETPTPPQESSASASS